jgi:GT2 family glycosyltransferase
MNDVSVVIVNWNTKDLLVDCIQTILKTTIASNVEIIVVDNGSSDGSAAAAAKLARVMVIRNETNMGFAAANNIGISASTGRFVCLVNSDVKVLEGCLDRMCQYMDEHPTVGLLGPRVLNKDLSLQRSCAELPTLWNVLTQALMLDKLFPWAPCFRARFMADFDHASERNVEVLSGCFLMARREAIGGVGLLDESFFIYKEDVDWCKRFGDCDWEVRFYPHASAIHYGGASSSVEPATFLIEMEKANLQYWRKHHSWIAYATARFMSLTYYWLRMCGWGLLYLVPRGNRIVNKQMMVRYAAGVRWLAQSQYAGGESLVRQPARMVRAGEYKNGIDD